MAGIYGGREELFVILLEVNRKVRDVVPYQLAIVHYVLSVILVQVVNVHAGSLLEDSLSVVVAHV